MKLSQVAEYVHPNVTNDIIAGGAVAMSWTTEIHEWLSIIVTVMAGIYYLWGFYLFLRRKHCGKRPTKRGHNDPD